MTTKDMCMFLDTDGKEKYTSIYQMLTSLQARGLLKDPISIPFHNVTRVDKTSANRPGSLRNLNEDARR